jgi:fructoselysine-6-P-deglycase FrlB-like protein
MSEIAHEIASQPEVWLRSIDRASEEVELLPPAGMRIAAFGCGTSLYMAQAYAGLREDVGAGETDAFPASEMPLARSYDMVLAISRSGTTTEVVERLRSLASVTTLVLTAVADSPVTTQASRSVVLEFADERSVVQTRFATGALALLRAHLGQDLRPAIADAQRAIEAKLPVDPTSFGHWVFLGRGWTVGLANEAALKMREATGSWAESYPAMEYRHGPISVATAGTVVWAIGNVEAQVLEDVSRTGATIVSSELDPMAELIRIQRTAVALAQAKGLDPDHPRHLTRSVVLT